MRTVYMIGYPGAGKSTAMRGALERATSGLKAWCTKPFSHARYLREGGEVWHLGKDAGWGGDFPGTDTLGMGVNPQAIAWMAALATAEFAPAVVVGEGDRLANRKFLSACPHLTVVLLAVSRAEAQVRALERAARLGRPPQNRAWWEGRCTKVDNLSRWAQDEALAERLSFYAFAEGQAETVDALAAVIGGGL